MQEARITALIVAAGRGMRAGGGLPKQFRLLAGRSVLARAAEPFRSTCAEVVVVAHPDDRARAAVEVPGAIVVAGGATRTDSVRAGLAAVTGARVLIHDAARPGVTAAVIGRVVAALQATDGAAPALPVTDALWHGDGFVEGVRDRAGLWRAQTPQGFRTEAIRAAYAVHPGQAADDVEVARAAGLRVAIVAGDEALAKITGPEDHARMERAMAGAAMDVRLGNGFDVHAFGPGDGVTLCGVSVPHDRGLLGHSDADVGLHAITDAIYGALAEGDIGRHFPPSDARWKGADSAAFLEHAGGRVAARGYRVANVDATLICEAPKIAPHAEAMRARVAAILGLEPDRVSVKATTTERLGFAGRGEGIACSATVALVRP